MGQLCPLNTDVANPQDLSLGPVFGKRVSEDAVSQDEVVLEQRGPLTQRESRPHEKRQRCTGGGGP